MKKGIVISILLLMVGFVIGRLSGGVNKSDVSTLNSFSSGVAGSGSAGQTSISPSLSPSLFPSQASNLFLVTRVIDGDTIELENGERVRYIGIDTPETVDPRKPVQCFGVEASKKNKELVEKKQVWLVKDVTDRDRYGRPLRYVYLGDPENSNTVFVNLELVKEGFAHS